MAQAKAARGPGINVFDESRPMWQKMLLFLIPMLLTNVLQSGSQLASTIYVGRLIGVSALGAMSIIAPIFILLIALPFGLASGSSVMIGQAFGARDMPRVKKVAGTTLGASLGLGVLIGLIGYFGTPGLLHIFGTPVSLVPMADAYARIIFLACPVFFPYLAYTTSLRGTADAQTPFYFLIFSTVLALLLVPVGILGWFGVPALGITGAALGGMLAQAIAFVALIFYLRAKDHPLKFDSEMARDMLVDTKLLWQVVRIGVPTSIQIMSVGLAEAVLVSFVNRYGASAAAAYGAVNQIVGYVQFPAMSVGIGASIFGAQCIGAKREDLLNSVVRSGVALNYAVAGFVIGLCYLFATQILGWFITDPATVVIAHGLLMITLWSYLLFGNSAVLSGVMRGSGTVLWPTINGIFAILCVEVPSAFLLMQHYHLPGIWMGYPISFAVVLALQFQYYHRFWKPRIHARLIAPLTAPEPVPDSAVGEALVEGETSMNITPES